MTKSFSLRLIAATIIGLGMALAVTGCSTQDRQMRKYERYVRKSSRNRDKHQALIRKQQEEQTLDQVAAFSTEPGPSDVEVDY